jgi:hypothetical protein
VDDLGWNCEVEPDIGGASHDLGYEEDTTTESKSPQVELNASRPPSQDH